MNYYNFVKSILTVTTQHNLVAEFAEGDIYSIMNETNHKYPAIVLTTNTIQNDGITDIQTINGTLFYVDRLLDNQSNKLAVQSNGMTILKQIFVKLQEAYDDITIENEVFTPFYEKFSDICGGVFCTFSISYANDVICSDSEYEIRTITLTHNGLYDVTGYELAVVNVVPVWGTITGNVTAQTDLVEYIASQAPNIEAGENITIDTSGSTKIINAIDTIYDDSEVREEITTVSANTGYFRGVWNNYNVVPTDANLYPQDYTGSRTPTNNDYIVLDEASGYTDTININIGNNDARIYYKIRSSIKYNTNCDLNLRQDSSISLYNGEIIIRHTSATPQTQYGKSFFTFSFDTVVNNIFHNSGEEIEINNSTTVKKVSYIGQYRFQYVGDWATLGKSGWKPQYKIGSSFTTAQQAALDSGINATKVATYDGYANSITALQTDKLDKVNVTGGTLYGVAELGVQTNFKLGRGLEFNSFTASIRTLNAKRGDWIWKPNPQDNYEKVIFGNNCASKISGSAGGSNNDILIGSATGATQCIAIGFGAKAGGCETSIYSEDRNIAIGNNAQCRLSQDNIAIGSNAKASNNNNGAGIAIGRNTNCSGAGIAIGRNTNCSGANSIAIGKNANAYNAEAVQIGTGTNTTQGSLKFRDYPLVTTNGKIYDDRLQLMTINGHSIKGIGDITIETDGKVKKVSVHKAIPCSKYDIAEREYSENFGGKTGNLYYKPKNSYLVLRKVTVEQFAMLVRYNEEYFHIHKAIHQPNNESLYTVYLDFKSGQTILNEAILFEANTGVTLEEFLTDEDIRYSMIKNVSGASDIPCKSDFRIEKGHIICIKEPDLEIGHPIPEVDAPLGLLGFYGNNKELYIRNGFQYIQGDERSKCFNLDLSYNSGAGERVIQNYRAVLKKGWIAGGSNGKKCYKIVSTSNYQRLQYGYNVRIYPNARKRYRSIRYFDFRCASGKYIQKRII